MPCIIGQDTEAALLVRGCQVDTASSYVKNTCLTSGIAYTFSLYIVFCKHIEIFQISGTTEQELRQILILRNCLGISLESFQIINEIFKKIGFTCDSKWLFKIYCLENLGNKLGNVLKKVEISFST